MSSPIMRPPALPCRLTVLLAALLVLAGCGQKGPLYLPPPPPQEPAPASLPPPQEPPPEASQDQPGQP
ncbi:MAG: lipoprotein [Pseudomonadota bacterium]|nr:lipoprotein [Pseudomonadota bacterium]